jgi:hypothetical protein
VPIAKPPDQPNFAQFSLTNHNKANDKHEYFNPTYRAEWHRSNVESFVPERGGIIRLAQSDRALRWVGVAHGPAVPVIQRTGSPRRHKPAGM